MSRRRRRNAEETEAHSRYGRRVYAHLSRPGVLAAIKRRTSKADRREGRAAIIEALTPDPADVTSPILHDLTDTRGPRA